LWIQDLERGLLLATGIMTINIIIGFIATILSQSLQISMITGTLGFLELGVFLIIGGCLVSRQPLNDLARYKEDGEPTSTWKRTRLGRQLLFAAFVLFLYVGAISILSYIVPI